MSIEVPAPAAQIKSRRKAPAVAVPEGVRVASLDESVIKSIGPTNVEVDPRVLINDTLPIAADTEGLAPSELSAATVPITAPTSPPRTGFSPRPGVRCAVREVHIDTPFSSTPRKIEGGLRHLPHVLAVDTLHNEPSHKPTSRSSR